MTVTDRTGATDVEFAALLERIEAAPAADESAVEVVARAMCEAEGGRWDRRANSLRDAHRRLARAAIAALKPAPGTDSSGQATCGDLSPAFYGGERIMCELPYGHGGAHQHSIGGLPPTRWIEKPPDGTPVP